MGNFFESGKNKVAKGGDRLRLSFAVPKIQWDSNPTASTAIRRWETFILTFRWGCLDFFSLAYGIFGSFYLSFGGGSMKTVILSKRAVKTNITNQPLKCEL